MSEFSFFFLVYLIFWSSFKFTAKMNRRYRDFSYTCCPHAFIVSTILNIPHQSATFIINDEPTLTHHHLESIAYIRVHTWYLYILWVWTILWVCTMTCFCHNSIIYNSSTVLKFLFVLPIYPLSPLTPWNHSSFLLPRYFCFF